MAKTWDTSRTGGGTYEFTQDAQGNYNLTWNASEQASGMYLVRAETACAVAVQKILLLK